MNIALSTLRDRYQPQPLKLLPPRSSLEYIKVIGLIFVGPVISFWAGKISIKNYRGVFAKKGRGKRILFDKKNPRVFQQFACNLFLKCLINKYQRKFFATAG
jgi:hypothetical protein